MEKNNVKSPTFMSSWQRKLDRAIKSLFYFELNISLYLYILLVEHSEKVNASSCGREFWKKVIHIFPEKAIKEFSNSVLPISNLLDNNKFWSTGGKLRTCSRYVSSLKKVCSLFKSRPCVINTSCVSQLEPILCTAVNFIRSAWVRLSVSVISK